MTHFIFRFFTRFLTLFLWGVFLAAIISIGIFYYFGRGLPNYQQLATYEPPILTRFYANDGRVFAEYAWEKRIYVPLSAIPLHVRQAFLSAEDKNFYTHFGLDIFSILKAMVSNVMRRAHSKRPLGASTITQQVAKNFLLTEISRQVSYERKIKEAILAFRIEHAYTKDHILELYLNEIYLGSGSYGVAAAALNYFNKSLDELTLGEAAFLAALPKAPNRYQPKSDLNAALMRRNYVLNRMEEDSYISVEQTQIEKAAPLKIHKRQVWDTVQADYFAEEVRQELLGKFGEKALYQGGLVARTTLDPALQEIAHKALREGLRTYDRRHGWRGPVSHLTLSEESIREPLSPALWVEKLKSIKDPKGMEELELAVVLQVSATHALIGLKTGLFGRIPLAELKWARQYIEVTRRGPSITHPKEVLKRGDVILVKETDGAQQGQKEYQLHQIPEVSGALVALDPHTGRVLALEGGYSFQISQFNRAMHAIRQPGSAFKIFSLIAALEKGLDSSTLLYDTPFAIEMGYGLGIWRPKNWDNKFLGPLTVRRTFELSRNIPIVRMIHERVGMKKVRDVVLRLKIYEDMPLQLAMLLGAGDTTLMRMTSAFGTIANGGKLIHPTLLDRVQDRRGKTVFVRTSSTCRRCMTDLDHIPFLKDQREQIISPVSAYQTLSILEGVVQRGISKFLLELQRPVAGKSGTTNEFRDAWFIGFVPDMVVGVYIGFDQPRSLGDKEFGSRVAGPVVLDFFKESLKNKPVLPFRIPAGVKLVRVNATTGRLAQPGDKDVILEAFHPDTNVQAFKASPSPSGASSESSHDSSIEDGPLPPPIEPALSGTGGLY